MPRCAARNSCHISPRARAENDEVVMVAGWRCHLGPSFVTRREVPASSGSVSPLQRVSPVCGLRQSHPPAATALKSSWFGWGFAVDGGDDLVGFAQHTARLADGYDRSAGSVCEDIVAGRDRHSRDHPRTVRLIRGDDVAASPVVEIDAGSRLPAGQGSPPSDADRAASRRPTHRGVRESLC